LFTLLLAIVTALLFGIGPALSATRPAVVTALKDEAGSVVGGGKQARARRVLVVAQVALSMLLLSGAGLFARSLFNVRSVDPGFPVERLLTFSMDPSLTGYDPSRTLALFEQAQDTLGALPGVRSASMSEIGAFTGNAWSMTVNVDGYQQKEDEDMNPNVDGIAPRYFDTGRPRSSPGASSLRKIRLSRPKSPSSTKPWRSISFATPTRSAGGSVSVAANRTRSKSSASSRISVRFG
jgi:hypothetical protein